MVCAQVQPPTGDERKPRKSVAFADGAQIVDSDGNVKDINGAGENNTAESHANEADKAVDEVTDMFSNLAKKKKKKSSKTKEGEEDAPAADGEFDPSALKKKKKKKKPVETDDFEAKLAEAGATGDKEEEEKEEEVQEGDMEKGTGIFAHDVTTPINYNLLLNRFFTMLHSHHPDLASSGGKSYKIPPPQCLREGNKKTIFANISEICKRMKRSDEHVTQFLFAELGTSGSVDGSRRLVIKGRFQQKQIENVLRRYIGRSPCNTSLRSVGTNAVDSRVRYLQDVQVTRYRAQQGREPSVLRHLQLLRIQAQCHGYQDWFLCPGRQEKEAAAGLEWSGCIFRGFSGYDFVRSGYMATTSWDPGYAYVAIKKHGGLRIGFAEEGGKVYCSRYKMRMHMIHT